MRKYLLHVLIISFVFIAIPITSATGGSITLRSHYRSLSVSQVQVIPNMSIRKNEYGFHGHSTINHDYNLKAIRGDVVVIDNTTGLMWHQSGSSNGVIGNKVMQWVYDFNSIGYAGYYDWRLPTLAEATSLLESSEKNADLHIDTGFNNEQKTIWADDNCGPGSMWIANFLDGGVICFDSSEDWGDIVRIRPVRSMR